jgi:hypothetical protein|tara:strand:+ start:747 stop:980 length:234 start_codon:yes stop_codon:yes gene_type:complete
LAALCYWFLGFGLCLEKGREKRMELNITENLMKVLVRQRDVAMTKCAELEAKLVTVSQKLAEYENKEQAEDLFTNKE